MTYPQYYGNGNRQFFKQAGPTSGTYLECWVKDGAFAHILSTLELGSEDKLKKWIEDHAMQPSTADDFDSHFYQMCREMEDKRRVKNEIKDKNYRPAGTVAWNSRPMKIGMSMCMFPKKQLNTYNSTLKTKEREGTENLSEAPHQEVCTEASPRQGADRDR